MSSLTLTQATLGGTVLVQSLAALRADKYLKQNVIGAGVCAIAFQHYRWMSEVGRSSQEILNIRYMDWFLTLPLLYWECLLFSGVDVLEHPFLVGLSTILVLLMLAAGKLSTQSRHHKTLVLLGFLCLVATVVLFCLMVPSYQHAPTIISLMIIGSWFAYGILALMRTKESSTGYNILDLLNKACFGLVVAVYALLGET